ncbi:MAG: signal peptide peptidase SppA [Bacteroidales bacterium]|nr:signal peptide peptidase SppA [Bacteroidales bacterium]MCF8351647.1 signal peptide peptidase SppA [Bacteroidales bacterium]MCF8376138.1 signal peptide peptidase SppA [Bacteroidales bacterium]
MKQFFKFFFASVLGTFVTAIILFFILMGFFISALSYSEKEVIKIHPNSLLVMELNKPISDRTPSNPFESLNFFNPDLHLPPGLNDILKSIEKAKKDKNIEGILLDISTIPAGVSTLSEIRKALDDFKSTGKFVICYGSYMNQASYYLGSVANEVYLNPEGLLLFKGLHAEVIFIKDLLDKLKIDPQVVRAGNYKSAVEPLLRNDLSEENREQLTELVNSIWDNILIKISESRNISIYDLNMFANKLEISNPQSAVKHGFVDGIKYKDEIADLLREKLNIGKEEDLLSVKLEDYIELNKRKQEEKKEQDRIAVIYAEGDIVMGKGDNMQIGSATYAKAIKKAREDKKIKAVVFRVNSPGGGVMPSEIIRREIILTKAEKPVVVSMGDVAASGGYWISCNADKILAEETTVTGSIGVFGVFPSFDKFLKEYLHIHTDEVKTNNNADFLSSVKPMNESQLGVLEDEIDRNYQHFLQLVAEARNMNVAQVDSIAGGRVWSGSDAVRIGLVDELGGLEKAISTAAELAGSETYTLHELPVQKGPFEELFDMMPAGSHTKIIKEEMGELYKYYEIIKHTKDIKGMQARLPYYLELN